MFVAYKALDRNFLASLCDTTDKRQNATRCMLNRKETAIA